MAGRIDATGLRVLAGEPRSPIRAPRTASEVEIARLTHSVAVLTECLEIAIRGLSFVAWDVTKSDLRLIRDKLAAAGVEVKA